MNRIVCYIKGHVWKDVRGTRMIALNDNWPPNYIGGASECQRCHKTSDKTIDRLDPTYTDPEEPA